uniref:DUF3456 domain-containing protein n=1 Tax=Plectus sambesii TaxID=2011161 RepID=A0A914VY33_9BILA
MIWAWPKVICVIFIFAERLTSTLANKANVECGACTLLIGELERSISLIDPRKKIEVGSFRVDPTGSQRGLNEIPFARSETHIYELFDNVCDRYKDYALAAHPTTGKYVYVRTKDYDSKLYRLPGSDSSSKTQSRLNTACHSVLDDQEEALVKFLSKSVVDPVREFCHVQTELCSSVDVTKFPLEYLPEEPKPAADASKSEDDETADKTNDDNDAEDEDKDEL